MAAMAGTAFAQAATKVELATAQAIAKKYWQWTSPLVEKPLVNDFKKVINWTPTFDGKKKDDELATHLSQDIAFMGGHNSVANLTVALACAAFDISWDDVHSAQNLGAAIAQFAGIEENKQRIKEIHADSEKMHLYAIGLSLAGGNYSANSLGALVSLGNLYLDMDKDEEAKAKFESALKVRKGYSSALTGMIAYYEKKKQPQMISGVKRAAKENPTKIGQAFNEIEKEMEKLEKINRKQEQGVKSVEAAEKIALEFTQIHAVTYADIYKEFDRKLAAEVKRSVQELNDKMILKIPDLNILMQYSVKNEHTEASIISAAKVIAEEDLQNIQPYKRRYMTSTTDNVGGFFNNLGVTSKVDGQSLGDFMSDMMRNPEKYADRKDLDGQIEAAMNEMIGKATDWGKQAEKSLDKAQQKGKNMSQADIAPFTQSMAQVEPIVAIFGVNPFEYANPWDIFIQQYNARALLYKWTAMQQYLYLGNERLTKAIPDIMETYYRKKEEVENRYAVAARRCDGHERPIICEHGLHREFFPQFNEVASIYFAQATQIASVHYRKLEENIPKMYQDIMKHLVYISDEKIQQNWEDKVVGTIAFQVESAITWLLTAYSIGDIQRLKMCGCDMDEYYAAVAAFEEEKAAKETEYILRQKAAASAFRKGELDKNTQLYKSHNEKYGNKWNFLIFTKESNDFYTHTRVNIPTPRLTFTHSTVQNNVTGKKTSEGSVSANASLKLGKTVSIGAEGEVKWRVDEDGKYHLVDVTVGALLGVSGGASAATFGLKASLVHHTLSGYAALELSGNGPLDELKAEYLEKRKIGGARAFIVNRTNLTDVPNIPKWKGEYTFIK